MTAQGSNKSDPVMRGRNIEQEIKIIMSKSQESNRREIGGKSNIRKKESWKRFVSARDEICGQREQKSRSSEGGRDAAPKRKTGTG